MYDITNPQNTGRVIAIWSPVSRQGAVSTTAALLASYMDKKVNDGKVLILSTDAHGGPTACYYMSKERMVNGLAEVIELSISDNLKGAEDIFNNTFSISATTDILACSKMNTNVTDFLSREISNILNVARTGYKYIIVDTLCGKYDASTQAVLRNADAIIVCMPQDKYIFDSWVRKMPDIYIEEVEKKPTIIVSAMHYEYPDMSYKDMDKELKGHDLYYISLNDLVHKAVSDRNIPELIANNMSGKTRDDVGIEIEAIYDKLIEIIDSIIENEMVNEQKLVEETKKETQKYLESNEDLFNDMGYEDDSAAEAANESDGQSSDMDALYGPTDSGSES